MHIESVDGSLDSTVAGQSGLSPKHQFGIQSQLYLPYSIELSNNLYYVDSLPNIGVQGYYRLDSRIMWTVKPGLELSLVGQNLLDDRHQEFSAPVNGTINEMERNFYGKVTVRF
jgi:iron complex outermembrane receptor protein